MVYLIILFVGELTAHKLVDLSTLDWVALSCDM